MTPTEEPADTDLVMRPATRDDLAAVHEVFLAASTGPGQPTENRSPEDVRAWVENLPVRGQEIWLASRDDTVLGFVSLRGSWVPLLFVHPERPARGVGAALLDLVKGLRPHGFGLRVHAANTRAREFYRRHGLIETKEEVQG